jgi:hypothetical protein
MFLKVLKSHLNMLETHSNIEIDLILSKKKKENK